MFSYILQYERLYDVQRLKIYIYIYIYIYLYKSLRPGRDASDGFSGPSLSKTLRFTTFFAIFFAFRGASRARKVVENHTFYHVSRAFRFPSNLKVFSFAFSKQLRKPRVLPRFSVRKSAVPRPFFRCFCTLAL